MKYFLIYINLFLWLGHGVLGQGLDKYIPAKPSPARLVNDFVGLLTPDQQDALEKKLVAYDDSTSTQITIVTIGDIGGNELSEFAVELGRKWGVGGKENNNGIVLAVLIDQKRNKRNVFIATGYGMEGTITDYTAKSIIENEILPNFRSKDIYRGLDEGINAIIQAAAGKYKAPEGYSKKRKKKSISGGAAALIFLIIIMAVVFSSRGGGGGMISRRGTRRINRFPPIFWFPSGGGGSSWGGGSGGGFGGFGGGGFGGGGSGGSW
jgi:uncharacterized protein